MTVNEKDALDQQDSIMASFERSLTAWSSDGNAPEALRDDLRRFVTWFPSIRTALRAASKDAEPVAWRIRERPGFPWSFTDYDPERMPNVRGFERQPLFTHPSTGEEGGVRVKAREALIEAIADELVAHGEFSSIPSRNHTNASKAAEAILPIILTAIEPVAASPGVPDGWKAGVKAAIQAVEAAYENEAPEGADYSQIMQAMEALLSASASPEPSPASEDVLRAAEIDAKFTEREKTVRMGRDPVAELRQEAADQTEGACLRIELVASNFPQGHAGGAVLREAVSTIRRYAPPTKEAAE